MLDLTNFLAYMTDPMKKERETIGSLCSSIPIYFYNIKLFTLY